MKTFKLFTERDWNEFGLRVQDRTLTAEEAFACALDVHKTGNSNMEILSPEEVLDRLTLAMETQLFYLMYFRSSNTVGFEFAVHEIEQKYFNPSDRMANADFTLTIGGPITFVLFKKDRITKYQLWEILGRGLDEEDKAELRKELDKSEDKDVFPLVDGSELDRQMVNYVTLSFEKYRNKVLDKVIEAKHKK